MIILLFAPAIFRSFSLVRFALCLLSVHDRILNYHNYSPLSSPVPCQILQLHRPISLDHLLAMPREKKKRGRRAADAQKRKRDDEADNVTTFPKRRRTSADEQQNDLGQQENLVPLEQQQDDDDDDNEETTDAITTAPFYGLLSESEREYFKNADRMLEANSFADAEERLLFVRNVAREASGKELKLACTQACSRLLERLMLLADPSQLKSIFQKFAGQ